MSDFTKGQGDKIGIQFTEDLVGDVSGNVSAFTVSGKQYRYIGGDLIDKSYTITSVSAHPTETKSILLTFDPLSRFCTNEGDITISYDSSKGNLSGEGGAVESFTKTFTPADLIPEPNPGIVEQVTVSPSITVDLIPITYSTGYTTETITTAPLSVVTTLDYRWTVEKAWLEASTQLVKFNSSGQLMTESQSIVINAITKVSTSPTYAYKVVIGGTEYDNYYTVNGSQITINMVSLLADHPDFTQATLKMTMTDGSLILYDYMTIYKVQDGSSDVVSVLSNEYHTIVAIDDDTGAETELKLNQAFCNITVYQGLTDITDQYTFTKTDGTGMKSIFYPNSHLIQIVGMTEDSGTVSIVGLHSTLATQTKSMQLVKSKRGTIISA